MEAAIIICLFMARLSLPSDYSSVAELQKTLRLTLPKPYEWRLLNPQPVGQIHALPESRGIAVATNGILVLIMQGDRPFYGHLDWFEQDENEPVARVVSKSKREKKQPTISMIDFV